MKKRTLNRLILSLASFSMLLPLTSVSKVEVMPNKIEEASGLRAISFKTVFDAVVDIVADQGSRLIKGAIPKTGNFVIDKVFEFFGIGPNEKIVTNLKEINSKIDQVQTSIERLSTEISTNNDATLLRSLINDFAHFETVISPLYDAYTSIFQKYSNKEYNEEDMMKSEAKLYNGSIKNLTFGGSSNTGKLYDQLINLCRKITTIDLINPTRTLDQVYDSVYSSKLFLETQLYLPKMEFYGALISTLLKGISLFMFKVTYEYAGYTEIDENVAENEFIRASEHIKNALDVLKTYINNSRKSFKKVITSNKITNLNYGKKSSKDFKKTEVALDLYEGQMLNQNENVDASNHFAYYRTYQVGRYSGKGYQAWALDNSDYVKEFGERFRTYRDYFNKGKDYTVPMYMKEMGFNVDTSWNAIGILGKVRFDASYGASWNFNLYIDYLDLKGNYITNNRYANIYVNWLNSATLTRDRANRYHRYKAFITPDRHLAGTYKEVYNNDNSNGTHIIVNGGGYRSLSAANGDKGKVGEAPAYPQIEDFKDWWNKV